MGCLCSKEVKKDKKENQQSFRDTEISNILHQSISLKNSTNALTSLAELFITNQYEHFSLLHCPSSEDLLCRSWIYKRGHLVRTWKRRYCVLDKNDVNYYVKPSQDPPFGKKLKGQVAFFGAVCIDKESEDGKNIEVEIYGNVGEKDLFFSVENNPDGQNFVRLLQWAIRKSTLTLLARNLKATTEKKHSSKIDEKSICTQWKENQNLLFNASIQKLLPTQLYYFLLIEPSGQIFIKPCVMKLWNIFGESYLPNIHTESTHIGIAWHPIHANDIENYQGDGFPFFPDQMRFIAFEDIVDIQFQYVDDTSNQWLKQRINHLHHHGNFFTSSSSKNRKLGGALTGLSSSTATMAAAGMNVHPNNEENVYLVITISSKYDYQIHLLACCLHDYNDCLLALQHLLLFLNARNKLNQINATDIPESTSSTGSSCTNASIHQCSAAQAFNLVLD